MQYLKYTLEGINNRSDAAEDCIRDLEDKVEKNAQADQQKEERIKKKNEECLVFYGSMPNEQELTEIKMPLVDNSLPRLL